MTDQPLHPALARTGEGLCGSSAFVMPTRVVFGRGVAGTVGTEARSRGATRALLVTDPGVRATGLVEPVRASLEAAGIVVELFDRVQSNPRDVHCLEGAELARPLGVDLLVGLGGGSSIDTAKCIAVLLTGGGHPRDWEDFGKLKVPPLPVIALPTSPFHLTKCPDTPPIRDRGPFGCRGGQHLRQGLSPHANHLVRRPGRSQSGPQPIEVLHFLDPLIQPGPLLLRAPALVNLPSQVLVRGRQPPVPADDTRGLPRHQGHREAQCGHPPDSLIRHAHS